MWGEGSKEGFCVFVGVVRDGIGGRGGGGGTCSMVLSHFRAGGGGVRRAGCRG